MANERRLIDADALLEKLHRMIDYCKNDPKVNGLTALFQVGDAVMDCPTVEAIIQVRCKDCKHYAMWADGRAMNHCDKHDRLAYDDDFCSYGEKSGTQPQREDV